ncbi:alpha/beta hydrolase [uncultured Thiodictyon sp.]|uniref:alpha/beta hydrolase n=1 Tax=uncultured Thiodictyon sp. TaxID=1846217 RepID=UPI0025F43EF5|nr:alpha/beta hydrolase [uncultured Thiodictyon sp.]
MKPLHLLIQPTLDGTRVNCQWFGQSALRPEGTLTLAYGPQAALAVLPDYFTIDLAPLLAEIGAGLVASAAALADTDDLLPLRDLLGPDGLAGLCAAIYPFLWRASRTTPTTLKRAPGVHAWADPDRRLVRVWFATNRKREPTGDPVRLFSDEKSNEGLIYGRCSVFIPKSHKPGSTGTPWWRRLIRLESDDTLKLRATVPLPEPVFWGRFAQALATDWRSGERNAFVLIHGFNVSFEEAAIRAAQIGYDLKLPGEMAFYSWPSRGGVLDYAADESTITASVGPLAQFLEDLCARSGAERVHLFVHSMGNRGFLSALERLAARQHPPLRLGQVFFCAPDEDVRTFADKTRLFPQACENRTLLVSPQDKAVALSRWQHQHDRVGIVPPLYPYEGIETIAVTGFGLLDLGHGYFAAAEPVILDLREAIESRRPAAERRGPRAEQGHFVIDVQS